MDNHEQMMVDDEWESRDYALCEENEWERHCDVGEFENTPLDRIFHIKSVEYSPGKI